MYGISIDRQSSQSATRQLCDQLRAMIQAGRLEAGTRLLPTRVLAKEWGIARNVVVEVYEQLTAEGYLEGRVGSGTYVAEGLVVSAAPSAESRLELAKREDGKSNASPQTSVIDFATGIPDQTLFPASAWARALKAAGEAINEEHSSYGDIRGDQALRSALRDYLFRAKGIQCSEDQIFVVSGTTEGVSLLAQSLSSRFHSIYIENPTIGFTRDIFQQQRYNLVPVEVDRNGMNVDRLSRFASGHLALITPSHQFPTGSLLSIKRRQKAIHMAEEADTYLIEDDYDSEFRLRGIPVPPMHTLSPARVIYAGTFSKTLMPSLRTGFLIIPAGLTRHIADMKERLNLYTPLVLQKALARFIADGQFERHVLAMKKVYKKRRMLLKDRLYDAFGSHISVLGDEAGMHVLVQFTDARLAQLPWKETADYGFLVETTDDYQLPSPFPVETKGIVLGYGNLTEQQIEEGVQRIRAFAASIE
ncbi:PLP-dependent aminotransferase family protein [Paenibacillus nanensis]|uniref:PLP-dependent aminotransferase family protein n=1 Tax=Paenibacillus nanensis TaxID=393251 RepID=A0A3A1UR75_9BACL|nr:PLP-dependent aminotransferase family protein [Paenibacillus nanensis]RIX50316.1 PLP-dependent aminotransferase family protein [Paenibacillus nanensis]